jgi:tetratricopeptide (TPR) repeat protein
VAALLTDADDALFEGDDIAARDLCLSALERAPRHPSIVARIVDIDARAGGRAEAALSLMNESRGALSRGGGRFAAPLELPLGTLNGVDLMLGTLLAETGDIDGAVASLARFVAHERSPALSARVAALAASLCSDPFDAARHLDEALAREPRSRGARWLRVAKRLEMERPGDALADVEHLDALAHGKTAKHAVWMRAGGLWRRAGHGGQAGELFERALRYVPDDAVALAGLGVALVEESRPGDGRDRRGITVLSRALAVAERAHTPSEAIRLDLARFLAERIHDFPAAIAHVSQIAPAANEAGIARGLEGRWRAQLGDVAGASIAFERLREHTESQAPLVRDHERARALMELLVEGAELFEKGLHDLPGALRCLEVAHGILPEDPDLRARYRQLREQTLPCGAPAHSAVPEAMAEFDVANASARVEELTQRLRADPSEDVTADELAFLLERLGRSHELVALLFARMEDASGERRARLLPRVRETLERVAEDAEVGGRLEEASLFRVALAGL